MHVPHLALRTILSWLLPPVLLRLMPAKLQTRIWHKVHGVLLNRAKRPRVQREYILCNIILNMVPRLREPASILEFGCSSGALTQRLLHFVDVAQNADMWTMKRRRKSAKRFSPVSDGMLLRRP